MSPAGNVADRPSFGALVVEWIWRVILSLGAAAGLIAGVLAVPRTPMVGGPVVLVCAYLLFGFLLPGRLPTINRAIGRAVRGPYSAVVKPYVLRPLRAMFKLADDLLVGTGRVARAIFMVTFKLSLWLVGLIVVLGIGWVAVAGIAALPVSIAVVVGALIVAGALGKR